MPTDLTVILENRPGTIADMGEATGSAGVNIDGICGFPAEGRGVLHLLVEDAPSARSALEGAGLQVEAEREVVVVELEDRPGMLGGLARKIADAGANVDLVYATTNGRLVLGGEDVGAIELGSASSVLDGDSAGIFSFPAVCRLVSLYSTKKGTSISLCKKLDAAADAESRGQTKTRDNILNAFQNEVRAQTGKALSPGDAQTLTVFGEVLKSADVE
jgi:hypothetical protein